MITWLQQCNIGRVRRDWVWPEQGWNWWFGSRGVAEEFRGLFGVKPEQELLLEKKAWAETPPNRSGMGCSREIQTGTVWLQWKHRDCKKRDFFCHIRSEFLPLLFVVVNILRGGAPQSEWSRSNLFNSFNVHTYMHLAITLTCQGHPGILFRNLIT